MGMYAPESVVPSADIAARLGVEPEWIDRKIGVRERRAALPDETAASMAADAAAHALADAVERNQFVGDPGMLVTATSTPDRMVPAPVYDVHGLTGLPPMPCLSIDGACAGFAQGMITALGFYRAGLAESALIVGTNRSELMIDPGDRTTAALFGDGAGAFVMGPVPDGYGILSAQMLTDSRLRDAIHSPRLRTDAVGRLTLNGRQLVETFSNELPTMIFSSLDEAGLTLADVDRMIIHQGNVRMVELFTAGMGLAPEQVPVTGDRFANTAAASLPMTAVLNDKDRPLQRGDVVVFATAGAGVNGAVIVLRWY